MTEQNNMADSATSANTTDIQQEDTATNISTAKYAVFNINQEKGGMLSITIAGKSLAIADGFVYGYAACTFSNKLSTLLCIRNTGMITALVYDNIDQCYTGIDTDIVISTNDITNITSMTIDEWMLNVNGYNTNGNVIIAISLKDIIAYCSKVIMPINDGVEPDAPSTSIDETNVDTETTEGTTHAN